MHKFFLSLLCATGFISGRAEIIMTELMQSNVSTVIDDLNQFPDSWVELYNPDSGPADLSEYSLSLSPDPSSAYRLPNVILYPESYILVYCDKENHGLHTDFRLESSKGGSVYLFKESKIVGGYEDIPKMISPDVAFGLIDSQWGWVLQSTPAAPNQTEFSQGLLPEPVFNYQGSVNPSEPFMLHLKIPADAPPASVIRYTLDGSAPHRMSPMWLAPMWIDSTTIVRAALFCPGYISPLPSTESFIFMNREMNLPIVSLTTDSDYFYGEKLGILLGGDKESVTPNYLNDWRRPLNIELFDAPQALSVINQIGETRVKGGGSRGYELKSLVMYANKRFGTKRFNYEFFPDDAPGLTDWKSFELRNSGNDFYSLYFRDALIQYSFGKNVDLDFQFYRPAIIMINGEYKGMLNIRSRTNEDLIYTTYEGLEDITLVENWTDVKAGSTEDLQEFVDFYSETGHSFDEYARRMDIGEYANYMLMNLIFDNKDFPGNNIVMWRPRRVDGRWRWIAKDTDFGLGNFEDDPEYKTFDWLYNPDYDESYNWANQPPHTLLFRNLMEVPEFRALFTERAAIYLGDFLRPELFSGHLTDMYSVIKPEYIYHQQSAYHYYNWKPWAPAVLPKVQSWMERRVPFFNRHLAEFYDLGKPVPVRINMDGVPGISLYVNDIELSNGNFNGEFFSGHLLKVSGYDDGDEIVRWTYKIVFDEGEPLIEHADGALLLTIPQDAKSVYISPGNTIVDSLNNIFSDEEAYDVYDLSGRHCGRFNSRIDIEETLNPGIYILRHGDKSFKHRVQ